MSDVDLWPSSTACTCTTTQPLNTCLHASHMLQGCFRDTPPAGRGGWLVGSSCSRSWSSEGGGGCAQGGGRQACLCLLCCPCRLWTPPQQHVRAAVDDKTYAQHPAAASLTSGSSHEVCAVLWRAVPCQAMPCRAVPLSVQRVVHTEEEWKELLSPGQFYVLRQAGTELPRTRCVKLAPPWL